MLPLRLNSNLIRALNRCSSSRSMIRCLSTSQSRFESETSRIIKLRKEREAGQEHTTGFDKMLRFNELHIRMMKKHDTPQQNRKRDLSMLKMLASMAAFYVAVCLLTVLVYWAITKGMHYDIVQRDLVPYWLDGNPLDRFKSRPRPLD